jgi:CDP-glycerol glycerophosphotransferase
VRVLIVYQSFEGRFSDSPRVLYHSLLERQPGAEHVWLADRAHAAEFPAGTDTLEYGSDDAVRALESADLLVANTHTDFDWRKTPATVYLQTWHGTPLKRVHWDVMWAPEGRLERLSRDVARWDYLVSPNRASTSRLRGAFRFEGEVLETGYPRNDILCSPDCDAIRTRVRRELGISDDTTAVLYTPTWRDDMVFSEGGKQFALELEVDAFMHALGADHCLLLRLHYMLTGRLGTLDNPSVREVSRWPDIAELYLAADILVTDYSSTMFDFAVTGKPIIFYAYDLDDYVGRLRGFYFDFATQAPGPVLATVGELIEAVREIDALHERHAEAYARFQETYCYLEDGHAADRVLDRVMPAVARTQATRSRSGSPAR